LQDEAGATIMHPGAGDCARAPADGALAVVEPWQPGGEFDVRYALPSEAQPFGTNHRTCDRTHRCALVVTDANPTAPVYRFQTTISFADQGEPPSSDRSDSARDSAGAHSATAPDVHARPADGFSVDDTTTTNTTVASASARRPAPADTAATSGAPGPTTTRAPGAVASKRHGPDGGRSSTAGSGGTATSPTGNGAGSTGGTTPGTVSGSGSGPGSGGGPGSGPGAGPGPTAGGPPPTPAPTSAPTLPPVTVPPTLPSPPTSDPVCPDLSDALVDPTRLLAGCGVTIPSTAPADPVTGILDPILGRR
jgi:hypothetical protein